MTDTLKKKTETAELRQLCRATGPPTQKPERPEHQGLGLGGPWAPAG